jgi:hypothetical protein
MILKNFEVFRKCNKGFILSIIENVRIIEVWGLLAFLTLDICLIFRLFENVINLIFGDFLIS